jgi:hypothetical protein
MPSFPQNGECIAELNNTNGGVNEPSTYGGGGRIGSSLEPQQQGRYRCRCTATTRISRSAQRRHA